MVGHLILGIGEDLPYDSIFVFNWCLIMSEEILLSKGTFGLVLFSPLDP